MADQPSDVPRIWHPGDHILLRYRRRGPVSFAYPVTVVRDDPGETVLYLRPGTPIKRRVMPDGSPDPARPAVCRSGQCPPLVGDGTWHTNHALILVRPGDAFDIRLYWTEHWSFRGWYVNLQQPVRRVRTGFDTADHVLDLWVDPDGAWSWKDEHEMAEAVRIGRFSAEEAAAIRSGWRVGHPVIESRHPPFDGSLDLLAARPRLAVPSVPPTWNDD